MSARNTIVPLLAGPWQARAGARLPGTPLAGLSAEDIERLNPVYPGRLNADIRRLLRHASGLAETLLGDIDFTGRWFPEEPLTVLRPCLSLAVDGKGRRWIAEGAGAEGLPGPVWCVLVHPPIVMYVSNDLSGFLAKLHADNARTDASPWLQDLSEAAFAIWDRCHGIAMRSRTACLRDRAVRNWLYELPPGALVYDLRRESYAAGWPYRLGKAESYLYRCGRLALFAVAD